MMTDFQLPNHLFVTDPPPRIPLAGRAGSPVGYAVVDAVDVSSIGGWAWRLSSHGYASRSETVDGRKRTIYMHREIMAAQPGTLVDHINADRLDNRRVNLRMATAGENAANSADRPRRSGYRGVYPHRPTGRWIAQISLDGHVRHLGIYDDPADAAMAYDLAARAQWGQFARTSGLA